VQPFSTRWDIFSAFRDRAEQKGLPNPSDAGKWGIDNRFDSGAGRFCAGGAHFRQADGSVPHDPLSDIRVEWPIMATHPDDQNPQHGDEHDAGKKPEGEPGKPSPKHTKVARQPSKPTMMARDEDKTPPVPNMSLEEPGEEIPVLEAADDVLMLEPAEEAPAAEDEEVPVLEAVPEGSPEHEQDVLTTPPATAPGEKSKSHITAELAHTPPPGSAAEEVLSEDELAVAQPVSDVAEALPASDVAEAEPLFEEVAAEPVDMTGADVPGADVTGAEHVLGDDLAEAQPASAIDSGVLGGSDILAAEPVSGTESVLGDEPLDRGSRPSARVESPIRTDVDDDAVDLGGPARPSKKKPDLDATEEVMAGEHGAPGSSAVNWNDVGSISDVAKPVEDETVAFDTADESSSVNLGGLPAKSKSPSGIDAVAEALESGVSMDDDAAVSPHAPPSVEFDDILADEAEPSSKVSGTKKQRDAEPEPVASAPTDDDLEAVAKRGKNGKKKKKSSPAEALEDEAAAALFANEKDDAEAVAVPTDEDEAVAAPVDDEEAVAAPVEDEEEAPRKKKGKGRVTAPVSPLPVATGPGCFGRLIRAGFFTVFGILVAVAGIAGVAYLAPELMNEVPETPWIAKKSVPPPKVAPTITPTQRAFAALAGGEYDAAIGEVKDDADEPAKAVRGQARVLKVLKERDPKKPLDKAQLDEINTGLKELREGKNDTLAMHLEQALQGPALATELQKAKESADELKKSVAKTEGDKKLVDALVKEIGAALAAAKIIENAENVKADDVKKALKTLADAQNTVAGIDKILKDANIKDAGPKGVAQLAAERKDSDEKLAAVNKTLADANVKEPGAKGVREVIDTRAKLQKDRDELDTTTKAAFEELVKGKLVPAGGDPRKQLVEGTKLAREKAESPLAIPLAHLGGSLSGLGAGVGRLVAKGVDTGLLTAELGLYRAREPFIQTPVEKLDTFAALLQDRSLNDPKQLAAIVRESDWVLSSDAKVSPEARAKALYVTGLAWRNEGKFNEARKALDGAVKHPGAKGATWQKRATVALAELTDPRAYYLPQIGQLQSAGNLKGALAQTDQALKVLPGDGRLLAARGLLRLQTYHGKGKLSGEAAAQIRKDADAAVKTAGGAADGAYVLGLLEEEQGQFAKAEAHLRAALKAHKGTADAASRYRAALARVLLQDPGAAAPAPADKDAPLEKKDAPDKKDTESRLAPDGTAHQQAVYVHPVSALLLSVIVGQAPEDAVETENPETAKRIRESVELAKSLADSKDPKVRSEGYKLLGQAAAKAGSHLTSATCLELAKDLMARPDPKVRGAGQLILGQALVKQGRRTEGLKEYARGMELLHPGLESREIGRMVEEHPAFQHPDDANKPNPLIAEKHFGKGLHLYWAQKYPEAEMQFKQALDYFGQDARYAYFLGLAQLAQKGKLKRDQAYFSFERGALLEAQNRPGIGEINMSLERIQGNLRQLLNAYRFKGAIAAAAPVPPT
jgi:hypothetical protein